jgi:hypothetical protein
MNMRRTYMLYSLNAAAPLPYFRPDVLKTFEITGISGWVVRILREGAFVPMTDREPGVQAAGQDTDFWSCLEYPPTGLHHANRAPSLSL